MVPLLLSGRTLIHALDALQQFIKFFECKILTLYVYRTFWGLFRNSVAKNVFMSSEELWEGSFALIACVMITVMALAMMKSQDMQEKWRGKLAQSMENMDKKQSLSKRSRKYALLILPMITVLREGLEAMIFVGGVSIVILYRQPLAITTGNRVKYYFNSFAHTLLISCAVH